MGAKKQAVSSVNDLHPVVDTDLHLTEQQDDILPYLEEPFNKILDVNNQGKRGQVEGGYLSQLYPSAGHLTPTDTGRAETDDVRSPEDVERAMELLTLDDAILTPGLNLRLGLVHHDELAAGFMTAYNNWLLDTILDEGYHGAMVVTPQKPEKSAEEIDRLVDESRIKAVMIPGGGVHPPLGREQYFPIYDAAENAGLPVMIHNAATGIVGNYPIQWRGTKRYIEVHVPYHSAEQMWHISTMLTNGIPVRFPDLDFVIQESGIGWIPYFMRRYDNEYSKKQNDAPLLEKRPSDYIRDQFFFTSQPTEGIDDPEYLCHTIRMFDGAENLMFSTDYPHYDFDYTDTLLSSLRTEFDDDEIQNIYGRTASNVFDL
ncbi:amidohydrolase family protein [Natrinema altunense]|uniref:Amidohydrolase n=1 Tax=Natrinema altunense TaxID=222984 RepID=A0A482XZ74_9EURY|nr:amidohydrolase family protein [Natrinema altunense]RZH67870.1 amidohydrolase [Natrinema altunense]